jgi:hypothetical protein
MFAGEKAEETVRQVTGQPRECGSLLPGTRGAGYRLQTSGERLSLNDCRGVTPLFRPYVSAAERPSQMFRMTFANLFVGLPPEPA